MVTVNTNIIYLTAAQTVSKLLAQTFKFMEIYSVYWSSIATRKFLALKFLAVSLGMLLFYS